MSSIKKMLVADLKEFPKNPRKPLTQRQMDHLKRSLKTYGNLSPITYNTKTKHILGGHKRAEALIALGEKETDVWCVELAEKQEKAAVIALNKIGGQFDEAKLKSVFEDLMDSDLVTGFNENEIDNILESELIPDLSEALNEFTPEKTYDNVGWIVIRCPDGKIKKFKDAIADLCGDDVQVETNAQD